MEEKLDIVANYQKMNTGKDVLYVDAENSLDVRWARKLGVDVDNIYYLKPESQSAEQIFDIIISMVETDQIGLWVLDSIGALISQQEWDDSMEEKSYGGISKPLTRFGKKIEQLMVAHNCTGVSINQLRDKIGSTYGGTTTTGGWGWKFLSSVRMEFRRGQFVDEKGNTLTRAAENPAGNIVLMSMDKNKTCRPDRRTGFYTINYMKGIDYLRDLIEVAIKYGIIEKGGAWYKVIDINTGEIVADKIQGQAKLYEMLEEDQVLLDMVASTVDDCMKGSDD